MKNSLSYLLEPGPDLSSKEKVLARGPLSAGGDPAWVGELGRLLGQVIEPIIDVSVRAGVGIVGEFTVGTLRTGVEFVRTAVDLLPGGTEGSWIQTARSGTDFGLHAGGGTLGIKRFQGKNLG